MRGKGAKKTATESMSVSMRLKASMLASVNSMGALLISAHFGVPGALVRKRKSNLSPTIFALA
jgi:hypothetical protein